MDRFDEHSLLDSLDSLTACSQAMFAACCATRLYSAYVEFHKHTGNGDPAVLSEALDAVWTGVLIGRDTEEQYDFLLNKIMNVIPSEEPNSILQPFADDAASSVAFAIRALSKRSSKDAMYAARRVYEALDNFVIQNRKIDVSNPANESAILSDKLIQDELKRQKADLKDLMNYDKTGSRDIVQKLRKRATSTHALPKIIES